MVSFTSLIALLGAGTAILGGIFISPLPKQIGFYRFLASQNLQLVGLTPAFHYGTEWNYSFERLHQDCTKIAGQNALVTGANSGVGYETAKALAKCGVNVTLGCRSVKKCAAAVDSIKKELPTDHKNEIIPMIVDMSSLKSVQSFSKEYLNKLNENDASLDMLYLNAGIANSNTPSNTLKESALSEDGIELIFATNYVGHHLMYRILEPLLKKSKMARVIQTSSAASFETFDEMATSLEVLNSRHDQDEMEMKHYGQSKLAQILWSKYLTKLMGENSTIYFNALHPGAVDTGIWGKNVNIPSWLVPVIDYARRDIMWTAEEGALTQIYLGVAVDELAAKDIRGKYFHPQVQEVVNERALNETLQEELWKFSEDLVSKFL